MAMNAQKKTNHEAVAVSVIMASYNCAPFLEAAVRSVREQTFENWELIVSDDASTDDTSRLLSKLEALDPRIRVIRSPTNRGAASARNVALALAKGRYMAFLDGDDLWKPHKLERQIEFMKINQVAFSFSSYERVDENGTPQHYIRAPKFVDYRTLLLGNVIGCLTAVYDTAILGKVEMPEIRMRQDYGLWLRLLKKTDRAASLQESLGYYRVRRTSLSARKMTAAKFTWRLLRDVENLPLPVALFYFSSYALRGAWSHYGRRRSV
jgi:glycosyltransferase involved in cell wall biosynthesis